MRKALMIGVPLWVATMAGQALAEAPAAAPDAEVVEEVTVIATRTEKKVTEVPATVSVITATQIEDNLVTDIKDLVRFEPGVSVRSSPVRFTAAGSSVGRDGNSGFNIRGLEGNRVLIQVDGIRVPDAFSFGAQSAGRGDYVGLDLLKSVEILRGPASALYGSDGVAGAVSFVTKDPSDFLKGDKIFGGQAKLGYAGADDSTGAGLVLAGRHGPWEAMIAYSRRDGHEQETKGTNAAPNITRTEANPQDVLSNSVLAKLYFTPSEAHRFGLTYDHLDSHSDTHALSAVAAPPIPPATTLPATATLGLKAHDTTNRYRFSLNYRYRGDGFIETAQAILYYQDSDSTQFASEDRNTAADRLRLNEFNTRVTGLNAYAVSSLGSHSLVYGLDASETRQESLRDGTVPPAGETYPTRAFPTTDYSLIGVYVQDEISAFGGKLKLYPALRYDRYDLSPRADALLTTLVPKGQSGSRTSPKLSAIYKITPTVAVFVNAAEGFKAPTPNQVNNAFTNLASFYRSIPNSDLKPETSRTIEGGLRVNPQGLSLSLTVFTGDYEDFIDQTLVSGNFTPTNPATYQFVNLGDVTVSGFEARLAADFTRGFSFTGVLSSSRGNSTAISGVKTPLASIDPWKIVTGLGYRHPTARFGGQFVLTHAAKKRDNLTGLVCTPSCYVPPAFTVADVTAWWDVTPSVTLRAAVFNLGDEKYSWWSDGRGLSSTSTVLDAYTQPGRNASVSLTYKF